MYFFLISKPTKVLLPFFVSKDIRPISFLVSPKHLFVVLSLVLLLAQISDNLKGFFSQKEIQKFPSVKIYMKLLSTGVSSVYLSSIFSISKTLGPELETLSLLTSFERILFLRSLLENLIHTKTFSSFPNNSLIFTDPFELLMYRKSLSLQCRSSFSATPIFLPHSLVIGIPLKNVSIYTILESCKSLWSYWGLDQAEFDFFLRKEALNFYSKNLTLLNIFSEPKNLYEACRIILFSEFSEVFGIKSEMIFDKDMFVFQNNNNLTFLEGEFGFFIRRFPKLSENLFVSDLLLKDDIIRSAFEQRKLYNLKTNV